MPNRPDVNKKQKTIKIHKKQLEWALKRAKQLGFDNFSDFLRYLLSQEESKEKNENIF
ncbi:MAG: hypothetical protein K1X66_02305 [Verrucomicrobiae bacterium]|nr:hypothetical protein [Verrucomicrobiae bacterium]